MKIFRIVGVPTEFRTQHFPRVSLKRYRLSLLVVMLKHSLQFRDRLAAPTPPPSPFNGFCCTRAAFAASVPGHYRSPTELRVDHSPNDAESSRPNAPPFDGIKEGVSAYSRDVCWCNHITSHSPVHKARSIHFLKSLVE